MTFPLFFFPVKIAWVDDDLLFLRMVSQLLKDEFIVVPFKLPAECLSYFKFYRSLLAKTNFVRGCTEADNYEMLNHMPVDLNINALNNLRISEARYSEISVLVVDYNMPRMNGIELCRQLESCPAKKYY